ncbi:GntR family transcriptional regulator [Carboxylicivirga sp. RSCT41]|uniref:GntR family transcriptional regulator n=1 Tax=Carboxylicivirga agarovorans TaxID=3417570 RepID=UPI003D346C11
MNESNIIQAIFKIDGRRKEPKSKQIINSVAEAVKKEILQIGECLPSLNNVSFELDVSRDTVQRAYVGLCDRGIIESVPGKGFFVKAKPSDSALKILLVFNKLTAYKKSIYNSFMRMMNTQANIDFHVHDYDPNRFDQIIKSSLDNYDYYVIMPFFYHYDKKILDIFKLIPKDKLVLVNKDVQFLDYEYPVIYEDFENDICEALLPALNEIRNYNRIVLVYPLDPMSNREIISGFEHFCKGHQLNHEVRIGMSDISLEEKELYIIIDDDDLAEFIKLCRDQKLNVGTDIGIVSYNETVLKEVLAEGITVISTDFAYMGEKLAWLILSKEKVKIKNPFRMIRRKSF